MLQVVELPQNLKSIGKNNFTEIWSFMELDMPDSIESIGEGSFLNNSLFSFTCYEGSVADKYAKENNIVALHKIKRPENTEKYGKYGDVNNDGKISASDSLMIQRSVVKLIKLDVFQTTAADVNNDGKVDNRDSLEVLRSTIGLSKNEYIGLEFVVLE